MLIRGTVRDAHGEPVGDAVVMFVDAPVDVPDIAAVTGDDGTFVMAAPAPGAYRLAVRAGGLAVREIDVGVDDGVDVTVTATLGPDRPPAG